MKQKNFLPAFFIIAAVTLLLDQLTKWWALNLESAIIISPQFSLFTTFNTGVSFGMLKSAPWIPTFAALLVVVLIPIFYKRIPAAWAWQISIALIWAGATGNLLDRFNHGAVVDFIALSFWPSFNIADTAITIGGLLAITQTYRDDKGSKKR